MKKILTLLVLCIMAIVCTVCAFACGSEQGNNEQKNIRNKEIVEIYNAYVAYAEEKGQILLSYEDWLNSIKGVNGQDGRDGVGVADMKIENGILYVKYTNSENFIELGQVQGADGKDGEDGKDGSTSSPYAIVYNKAKTVPVLFSTKASEIINVGSSRNFTLKKVPSKGTVEISGVFNNGGNPIKLDLKDDGEGNPGAFICDIAGNTGTINYNTGAISLTLLSVSTFEASDTIEVKYKASEDTLETVTILSGSSIITGTKNYNSGMTNDVVLDLSSTKQGYIVYHTEGNTSTRERQNYTITNNTSQQVFSYKLRQNATITAGTVAIEFRNQTTSSVVVNLVDTANSGHLKNRDDNTDTHDYGTVNYNTGEIEINLASAISGYTVIRVLTSYSHAQTYFENVLQNEVPMNSAGKALTDCILIAGYGGSVRKLDADYLKQAIVMSGCYAIDNKLFGITDINEPLYYDEARQKANNRILAETYDTRFIVFSDSHTDLDMCYEKYSKLEDLGGCYDKIIGLGDYKTQATLAGTTLAEKKATLTSNVLRKLSLAGRSNKCLYAVGNHDWMTIDTGVAAGSSSTDIDADRVTGANYFNLQERYNLYASHLQGVAVFGDANGSSYYYVDDSENKIRYIVLDTSDCFDDIDSNGNLTRLYLSEGVNIGSTQLNWYVNTALDFTSKGSDKNNWSVIVLCHMWGIPSISSNKAVKYKINGEYNNTLSANPIIDPLCALKAGVNFERTYGFFNRYGYTQSATVGKLTINKEPTIADWSISKDFSSQGAINVIGVFYGHQHDLPYTSRVRNVRDYGGGNTTVPVVFFYSDDEPINDKGRFSVVGLNNTNRKIDIFPCGLGKESDYNY